MSTNPVKVVVPLSSEEVKRGLADFMADQFIETLNKTCVLNHRSFSKVRAKWKIEYVVDDYGTPIGGVVEGSTGDSFEGGEKTEGELVEMPPDAFRRSTEQPIPAQRVIKKAEDNAQILRSPHRGRPRKDRV